MGDGSLAISDLKDLSNKIASKEDSCVFVAFFNSSDDKAYKIYLELSEYLLLFLTFNVSSI